MTPVLWDRTEEEFRKFVTQGNVVVVLGQIRTPERWSFDFEMVNNKKTEPFLHFLYTLVRYEIKTRNSSVLFPTLGSFVRSIRDGRGRCLLDKTSKKNAFIFFPSCFFCLAKPFHCSLHPTKRPFPLRFSFLPEARQGREGLGAT